MRRLFIASMLAFPAFAAHASTPEQRGLEVFRQVCSSCHSLNHVTYADLGELGLSVSDIKAYAAQHEIPDGLDDDGDPKTRPAHPSDVIGSPYLTAGMARMANHGGLPPDFSRLAMTQKGGIKRIIDILVSYTSPPEGKKLPPGSYYNTAMPHLHIAMPPPLHDGQIKYTDGTNATVPQMAHDVGAFLSWAAHPHLHTRHRTGLFVLSYLAILSGFLFVLKRRVWTGRTKRLR
ncbi:ubiquinol-cytochrome c reductase cytochrome c1 subunit [Gluconobacter frateurii NBRC 101659]|uniref:cytochrome c1 n=1 Tax=Gluconobacter japonicus TaxID=376620 RepID=UPI0002F9FE3B|nr:ubiquinol-cytochrome c reductase cytochrome c1 subunit [Gluconobacter frateurii NBRC 101659]